MTLAKKILATAMTLSSLGCLSIPERYFPENHISGVEYEKPRENIVPYALEEQIIYERRYYLQETEQRKNSLPMLFYPWETTSRELDLDSEETKLTSTEMYLPTRVERKKKGEDNFADGITLSSTGKYGTRAYMTSLKELRENGGISEKEHMYKIITTEENAMFMLHTMKILDKEYFVALVENEKINEKGKLPFYLIPVEGAKIKIDNICGNLSILNENQIYRPILANKKGLETQTENIIYSPQ